MKKFRIVLLSVAGCIVLLIGVTVWAFTAPRTVNVDCGQDEYQSALAKAGFSAECAPGWDMFMVSDTQGESREAGFTLNSAEFTALANSMCADGAPFSDARVRFCQGGRFEASFMLNDKAADLLNQGANLGAFTSLLSGRTLYLEGTLESGEGRIGIALSRAQIGKISLPKAEVAKLEELFEIAPGARVGTMQIQSITVGEDSFTYQGSLPSTEP